MVVYAFDMNDPTKNPLARISNLATILNVIIPILMIVASVIFFFMLISGAFMYLTSGDSPDKVKKAQSTFVTAVIGLIIVVCSFLVVKLLGYFFNIQNVLPI